MTEILRGCLFALPIAGGFFLLLRYNAPRWSFLLLGILPVCLPVWLISNLRVYGYHGWMQAGIVYDILSGHIPPHNPLFAGEPLLYPWGYSFLVAYLGRFLNLSPFYATALLSTAALVGILVVTFRISRLFTTDVVANLFATLVPLYAFTFTQDVNIMQLWNHSYDASYLLSFGEWRSMPIVEKFNGDTGYPFGFFLFGLFLYVFLRSMIARTWDWRQAGLLLLTIFGVGFTYPFFLPSAVCGGFVVCVLIALRNCREDLPRITLIALTLVAGAVLLLPYLLSISHGKYLAGQLLPNLSWPRWHRKIGVLVITCAPIWTLLAIYRRRLWTILKEHSMATLGLMISMVVSCGLFLTVNAPFASEYKFLSQGVYVMGILGGWCFSWIYQRRQILSFALLVLFLIPMGTDVARKTFHWRNTGDFPRNYYENGLNIFPKDTAQKELYAWMRKTTATNAIFLDSSLDLTIFGQRELYMGIPTEETMTGFGMKVREILYDDNGYNPALVEQRKFTLMNILEGTQPLTEQEFEPVVKRFANKQIYIIARTNEQRHRLETCRFLKKVFNNATACVFTLGEELHGNP